MEQTVCDLSEDELIASFTPLLPVGAGTVLGPGDDAAVLRPQGDLVVTTDVLVSGVHFRSDWSSPRQVGRKAAVQNLADVVAMAAQPLALTVSLVLPSDTKVAWINEFCRGLADECDPLQTGVVGGDLSSGETLSIGVTAIGDMGSYRPLTRADAEVGHWVYLYGQPGLAAAGYSLIKAGLITADRGLVEGPQWGREAVQRFLAPQRDFVTALKILRDSQVSAGMDVSDGLLKDSSRLAARSGVGIDFSISRINRLAKPLAEIAARLGVDPLTWVLGGGEDHAFIYTSARPGPQAIGRVVEGSGVTLDGEKPQYSSGWDHFRTANPPTPSAGPNR